MKVRRSSVGGYSRTGVVSSSGAPPGRTAKTKAANSPDDRIEISTKGAEVRMAKSAVLQAPDIRQEMVDEIAGQIERNQYDVDGSQVAPKMIREQMMLYSKGRNFGID